MGSYADAWRAGAADEGARGGALVGRQTELATIAGHLIAGASVTLRCATGVGSTRLLDELASRHGGAVLRLRGSAGSEHGPLGAAIAAVPALAELREGSLEELPARAGELLRRMAGDRRLLVLVDDAENLDPVTALGVTELRAAPWAEVVAAVHVDLAADCTSLVDGRSVVLDLAPLPDRDIAELAGAVLDGPLSPSLLETVVVTAAGRPFVAVELLEGARNTGAIVHRRGGWTQVAPLPNHRVASLLDSRLASLPTSAIDVLEQVALAGQLEQGVAVAHFDHAALRRLADAHLVVFGERASGHVLAIGHPCYRDVVLERLTPSRRRRHLDELVGALTTAASTPAARLQLAGWQAELGIGEPDELESAGRLALELGDHELAAGIARGALERGGGAHAHLTRGMALAALLRPDEADDHLRLATELAGSNRERAAAVQARAQLLALTTGRWDAAARLLADEGPTGVTTEHGPQLRALDGVLRAIRGGGVTDTTDAVPSPDVNVGYLAAVESAVDGLSTLDAARIAAARAVADATPASVRRALPLGAAIIAGVELFGADDPVHDRIAVAVAEARRAPAGPRSETAAWWRFVEGSLRDRAGQVAPAVVVFEDAAHVFSDVDSARIRPLVLAELALAYASAGATTRATDLLDELEAEHGDSPRVTVRCALVHALVQAQLGDPARAIERARAAADDAIAEGMLRGGLDLVHLAVRLGDAEPALAAFSQGAFPADAWLSSLVERHAAAVAAGDADALEAAAAMAADGGRRGEAAEMLAQAHHLVPDTGYLARATGLLASCPGLATPPLDGLAPARLEGAAAAAGRAALSGASNEQIGERLGVAPRSVERYLGSVYRVLGVGGRRDLRRWYRPTLPPFSDLEPGFGLQV